MKKILAITLALGMVLAFASCGGEEETSSVASTASTASVTTPSAAPTSTPTLSQAPVSSVVESTVDPSAPVNVALGGEGFDDEHDTYQSEAKGIAQAFDGSDSTSWQYNSSVGDGTIEFEDGIYLGVNFDAATIDSVTIVFEKDARAEDYEIQYTTDGDDWEEIDAEIEVTSGTSSSGTNIETDVATFEAIEDVTGIRVVMYSANGKYAPQIFELEVYGVVGAAEGEEAAE